MRDLGVCLSGSLPRFFFFWLGFSQSGSQAETQTHTNAKATTYLPRCLRRGQGTTS